MDLELRPLCTYRDYHSHARGGWSLEVADEPQGCRVTAFWAARPYRVLIDRGDFQRQPDWYWNFYHRAEAERGLDTTEDLFRPGAFRVRLEPGDVVTLIATAESEFDPPATAFDREHKRRHSLLRATPSGAPDWIKRLTLAADQFIVRRSAPGGELRGTTVIAGYPWFSDWGRDTMIALPGLALATGRTQDAAAILRTFAAHVSEGMLPNRFPDGGEEPEYNTVDATLWYFHAVAAYLAATADKALLRDLYPALRDIIDWHRRGTRYGIRVDPQDGMLFAGAPGVQLTWMDAKVGDWVVTPRIGKPVEINALWINALETMAGFARLLRKPSEAYPRLSAKAKKSFQKFWNAERNCCFDVVDSPGLGKDAALRPNQILAVSLPVSPLAPEQQKAAVDVCARQLLTSHGLRSLAPGEPGYTGHYGGSPRDRDAAHHQGTGWGWLLGPFALAHYRVYQDREAALRFLEALRRQIYSSGLGTLSEIFDGDAPFTPRGCISQAWTVAEVLRAWKKIADEKKPATS